MGINTYTVKVHHYGEDKTSDFCGKSITFLNEKGEGHRLDGPAYQRFNSDGILISNEYWVDGNLHRLDGPATQRFYSRNNFKSDYCHEEYWIEGKKYSKEDFLKKTSKEFSKNNFVEIGGNRFKIFPID